MNWEPMDKIYMFMENDQEPIEPLYAVEVLMDKIQSFENSDEIAAFFEEQQIVGIRQKSSSCPIARYLQQAGLVADVGAVHTEIFNFDEVEKTTIPHTSAMTMFVAKFDGGHYPQLVEQEVNDDDYVIWIDEMDPQGRIAIQ